MARDDAAAPPPPAEGGDGSDGGAPNVLDMLHEHWHLILLAMGMASIARAKAAVATKLRQAVALLLLVLGAVKLERVLSERVARPILRALFGDNDALRERLEKQEQELRDRLRELRQGSGERAIKNGGNDDEEEA